MCVCVCMRVCVRSKFQISGIILPSFRLGRGEFYSSTPPTQTHTHAHTTKRLKVHPD